MECEERVVHEVWHAESWGDLHRLAKGSTAQITVFDPYGSRRFDVECVLSFHSLFPCVPLFAYTRWEGRPVQDIFRLFTAGIRGVADQDVDDTPTRLSALLQSTLEYGMVASVLAALEDRLTPELGRLFQYLLQNAHRQTTPADAARVCCCHEKTLRDRLRNAGLPPTYHLITWTRLFAVAYLLGSQDRSVGSVARSLAFSSASALRNQVQRYLGICPTEVMERGGLTFLLRTFASRYQVPARGAHQITTRTSAICSAPSIPAGVDARKPGKRPEPV